MKQARQEGKIAFFRHTNLIIKEKMKQHSEHVRGEVSTHDAGASAEVAVKPRVGDTSSGLPTPDAAVSLGGVSTGLLTRDVAVSMSGVSTGRGQDGLSQATIGALTSSHVTDAGSGAITKYAAPASCGVLSSGDGRDAVAGGAAAPGESDVDSGAVTGGTASNKNKNLRSRKK